MGPLHGVKVIEIGGIGPGPFAAMVLADMGANVLRVDRPVPGGPVPGAEATQRGRPSLEADLKSPEGHELVLRLAASADALLEGHRPGVMERLGLGPDELLGRNQRLVYGRMTGYGQDGPLASAAGHDINYIAIAGVLGAMARVGKRPMFPLNLLGDYGGGGLLLAFGVVCALFEARGSGRGQVVDASMVEGASLLATAIHGLIDSGAWDPERPGTNVLDSGAPFYDVYETADARHMAVGAIEPQFYAELLELLGIDPGDAPQWDRDRWPRLKLRFAAAFRTRTREEWVDLLGHRDACVTPVLGLHEAPAHPHNTARDSFVEIGGALRPAPAPRFSRTPAEPADAEAATAALAAWGLDEDEIAALAEPRAVEEAR